MKFKMMLASLLRAFPFSTKLGEVKAARAKTIENGVVGKNVTNPILHSIQQRSSLNDVGIKFLSTAEETTKTSVWWDIENCKVPKSCNGLEISQKIRSALQKQNYCGSISIYAYGDTNQISSSVQHALSSTGVSLIHVPPGVKDGSDKKMIVDMLLWAMENRAPANVVLISGDGDFSYVFHQLRMKKYNVLLVRPEDASLFLIAATKTICLWRSIVGAGSSYEVTKQAQPSKKKMSSSDFVVESKKSQLFCKTCNLACSSLVDLNVHLSGKKHKKKAAVLVANQETKRRNQKPCCVAFARSVAKAEFRLKNTS